MPSITPSPHRGLFKTDRVLGTAQLKLDTLETACEVHEILEVRQALAASQHPGLLFSRPSLTILRAPEETAALDHSTTSYSYLGFGWSPANRGAA